jgi:ABC-type multidrug transport system permease subunit
MINNTGFILTLITFCTNLVTFMISLVVVSIIIYYIHYTRVPQDDKVVLCLSTNIYLLILALTAIIMSFNIQTLLGDLYQQDFNSVWCIFIGYMFGILFGGLYWSFVNQVAIN